MKVVSDRPGLVDFAIRLVFFVLNLPDGQVLFFGDIQVTEGLLSIPPIKKGFRASWNNLWASTCYLQLARMAGCKTDFLCTLKVQCICNKILWNNLESIQFRKIKHRIIHWTNGAIVWTIHLLPYVRFKLRPGSFGSIF